MHRSSKDKSYISDINSENCWIFLIRLGTVNHYKSIDTKLPSPELIMKRSLDEPTSEPRKSSRASHIETETASSSKVLKKDRRDSEGHLEATSTSSRTIKPVAPILTPAESYAKQKASAKRWAEEEFKKKATVPKSPAKPSIVALDAKAETLPAVTRKIRKSVTTPKVMPPSVAHAASVETAIIRPVPTIRIPLIKIERPRPQQ